MVFKSVHLNFKIFTLKSYNGRSISIVLEYDTRLFILRTETTIIIEYRIYNDHRKYFSLWTLLMNKAIIMIENKIFWFKEQWIVSMA